MRKETPVEDPEPPKYGEACVCGEICLYEAEARKRVKKAEPPPGGRYQALPCRRSTWWHVYLIDPDLKDMTKTVRRKREAWERELRRKLEDG